MNEESETVPVTSAARSRKKPSPPATATPSALVPVSPTAGLDLSSAMLAAAQLGKDGVEVLERLHVIAKEERAHTAKSACAKAMVAFRAEMPVVTKLAPGQHGVTHVGTRTKGMYAPFDAITSILDPIAARHGLTYRFDREVKDGKDYILCLVTHEGGHEFSSRFPAPSDKGPGRNDIQAIASGETYAKRYALIAAFGITTADPDDDAQASEGASEAETGEVISDAQKAEIEALLKEVPGDRVAFLAWQAKVSKLPVAKVGDILVSQFSRAKATLVTKVAEAKKAQKA